MLLAQRSLRQAGALAHATTSAAHVSRLSLVEHQARRGLLIASGQNLRTPKPAATTGRRALSSAEFGPQESQKIISKLHTTEGNMTHFTEKALSSYSQLQLFNLVSNVAEYRHFVPFCTDSRVVFKNDKLTLAKLTVGYGAITESYTSKITLQRPTLVVADSHDSSLFKTLHNTWEFSEAPTGCLITFKIDFEFSSALYSRLAGMLFREISQQTLGAFDRRCREIYGPPQKRL